jgi:single-strand DNA-binding protein
VSVNKQIIMGRLGKDPEYKTVGDSAVCTISVATSERWTDKKEQKQERTEWHEVNFWGKDADNIQKFFKKGDGIYVEGTTQTRSYDDKEGVKRYRTSVRATFWTFPDGKSGEGKEHKGRDEDGPPASGGGDDIPF